MLSLSYINNTLLHKRSELSGLITGPELNSSPLEAKNPAIFHGQQTFTLGHRSLTQASATWPRGPNISHDPCFRKVWLRPESTDALNPTFPMLFATQIMTEARAKLPPRPNIFQIPCGTEIWLRPDLTYTPTQLFSCSMHQKSLTRSRAYFTPGPNISLDPGFSELWLWPKLTDYPDQTFPMTFEAHNSDSG